MATGYYRTSLTGGGATALDGIDGSGLSDGDFAVVCLSGSEEVLFYRLDSDLSESEDSPFIIVPDANAGTTGWVLSSPSYGIRSSCISRATFVYNGGSTAYTVTAAAGKYVCKDKLAQWTSAVTTSAISSPSASTWYYLYLDYSAITSGKTITSSELVWSSTAPSWSDTYGGWYNGDDLCIFGAMANATPNNIYIFWHDGGNVVMWDDYHADRAMADLDDSWINVALDMPRFSLSGLCSFATNAQSDTSTATLSWRTNGSSASNGHPVQIADSDVINTNWFAGMHLVGTDWAQIIEIRMSVAGDQQAAVYTHGWMFSEGI